MCNTILSNNLEPTQNKRIAWLDLARFLAIAAVVLCHSQEIITDENSLDFLSTQSFKSKVILILLFSIGRLGVPLFLMISGYLLLDRDYNQEGIKSFLSKSFLHLLICTEVWFLIYTLFRFSYFKESFEELRPIETLLFVHHINVPHLWYLPMIIGTYVTVPMISLALKNLNKRYMCFVFVFCSIVSFLFPTLSQYWDIYFDKPLSWELSAGFSGGKYGLYLVAGYIIKKNWLKRINGFVLLFIGIICMIPIIHLQIASFEKGLHYTLWYDSAYLLILSIVLFELLSRIKLKHFAVYSFMSRYAFAIYIIHFIVLYVIKDLFVLDNMSNIMKIAIMLVSVYTIALIISLLISLIPKIGKYILYIK